MKNGESYNGSRRRFIKGAGALFLLTHLGSLAASCRQRLAAAVVRLTGTSHILGHRLWSKDFPKSSRRIEIPYLIIGGGVSGLSAARQFTRKGIDNFLLLEMEAAIGGNSSAGENKYSKYPLGAHYLPLPNLHDTELLEFLKEENIITGYDGNRLPIYDEQSLTFSPQERLFYNNTWQEGLIPKFGLQPGAAKDFERFFAMMEKFRDEKDNDGKYYFDIPVSAGSTDTRYFFLDKMTMKEWLLANDITADVVHGHIDYCCRDDFGLGIAYVSAWAGIHYFAGRKPHGKDHYKDNVLTWVEGNCRLVNHLSRYAKNRTMTGCLAFDVKIEQDQVHVKVFNSSKNETITIIADRIVIALPQFVAQYLLPDRKKYAPHFRYAPWLVATITLRNIPADNGFPLCWDNVIFGSKGLGYIYDQHQSVGQLHERKVITYYHSFSTADIRKTRRSILNQGKDYWQEFIMVDLEQVHPGFRSEVEDIHVHILGHGMISPIPGFITGHEITGAARPIGNKIYFAHSDLSGISIFEEAFHQGINVVNRIFDEAALDT